MVAKRKVHPTVKKAVTMLAAVKLRNKRAFVSAFYNIAHLYFNVAAGGMVVFLDDDWCDEMARIFSLPDDKPAFMFNECFTMMSAIRSMNEPVFMMIYHNIAAMHLKEYHFLENETDMDDFQDLMQQFGNLLGRLEKYAAAVLI